MNTEQFNNLLLEAVGNRYGGVQVYPGRSVNQSPLRSKPLTQPEARGLGIREPTSILFE